MRALLVILLAASASAANPPSVPGTPVVVKRVADAASWKKLRARAQAHPTSTQQVPINGTNYTIVAVISNAAFSGQVCPAGTAPKNAVYFTSSPSASAQDTDIYPVRLAAGCAASPDGSPYTDLLSVDADLDGNILDITLYNGALNLLVHPTAEPIPLPGDTQTSSLESFLARLVKHLTQAP